ncbi:hypothetical protein R6Q59_012719 [Mikania micrantha]
MMEKESPSHAPTGVFNALCDSDIIEDMPNLASDDIRMPNNCFKSIYATSAAGDNNSCSYTLTHREDFSFVDNNCEEKESGDLLYYGLPDIENFEDIDKMLRSCDSSFGLGVADTNDELGWFTSGQIEGTEDTLKMDFKFRCSGPSVLRNITNSDHDSSESNNHKFTCISESKNELNFKNQINVQKKHSKHQNQSEAKKAGHAIKIDKGSFYQTNDLTGNDCQLSLNNTSDQVFNSVDNQPQYRNAEFDYPCHIQNNNYLHQDYPHQTTAVPTMSGSKSEHQTRAVPTMSGSKSEHRGFKSTSPMGSSYASNQGCSKDSYDDPSFEGIAAEVNEQKQSCNSQGFHPLFIGSPRQMGMMFQSSNGVLVSAENHVELSVKEHESLSDIIGASKGMEIGALHVQESSSVSSELDKISLEATSFRQLRQVMEQLDLRSKICIRDSLYRLARSAEQRHKNPSISSHNDLGGLSMAERSNKCTGFMDIETDTNPIDRSIAHLLFHRPSESFKLPTTLPPNSSPNQSMLAVKLVCQEDAAAESNDTICED